MVFVCIQLLCRQGSKTDWFLSVSCVSLAGTGDTRDFIARRETCAVALLPHQESGSVSVCSKRRSELDLKRKEMLVGFCFVDYFLPTPPVL